jgi:hypothetical protein
MTLPSRYLAALLLPLLCACNQAGNSQEAINSAEINAQDARDDAEVRSVRLQELADQLNAQAAGTGGARARALTAEARQDSNAAMSVQQAGEARVDAIENNVGVDLGATGNH